MVVPVGYCIDIALDMLILCCLSPFCLYWVANMNKVSGEIWASCDDMVPTIISLFI